MNCALLVGFWLLSASAVGNNLVMTESTRPRVEIDDTRWPLVVTVMRDSIHEADVADMIARYDRMLRLRQRYVALVDLTDMARPPGANERRMLAEWSKARDTELSTYSLGYAIIVPNMMIRGALTALMWLHKTASPEVFVPDAERGLAWCIQALEQAYVPVSPQIRGYRHRNTYAA